MNKLVDLYKYKWKRAKDVNKRREIKADFYLLKEVINEDALDKMWWCIVND